MSDVVSLLAERPELRALGVLLAVYVAYNWLPRTPPATQPWRALWVVAEYLTWTTWEQAGVGYKGALGPVPKLQRHLLSTADSLHPPPPPVAGVEPDTDPPPARRGDTLPSPWGPGDA